MFKAITFHIKVVSTSCTGVEDGRPLIKELVNVCSGLNRPFANLGLHWDT